MGDDRWSISSIHTLIHLHLHVYVTVTVTDNVTVTVTAIVTVDRDILETESRYSRYAIEMNAEGAGRQFAQFLDKWRNNPRT